VVNGEWRVASKRVFRFLIPVYRFTPFPRQLVLQIMNAGAAGDEGGVVHQILVQRDVALDAFDHHFISAPRMRAMAWSRVSP